jgi:hypothetical protein
VETGQWLDDLLTRVSGARQGLSDLGGVDDATRGPMAHELAQSLSVDINGLLDGLAWESPAARAAARAAGERFDSHVLAAGLLEASHAAPASVVEVVARGLIRLTADVDRLARSRSLHS